MMALRRVTIFVMMALIATWSLQTAFAGQDLVLPQIQNDGINRGGLNSSAGDWGLDRINQRQLPLDNNSLQVADGTGVHVYVVDSGINAAHIEFGHQNIGTGFNTTSSNPNDTADCYGHGTYMAGIVAGRTHGVAPWATLHPVRVLDCNGNMAQNGMVDGLNWIRNNHQKPAVAVIATLDLLGSPDWNAATQALIDAGVTVVVAAGNSDVNGCDWAPNSVLAAINVAGSGSDDTPYWYTNYGPCVDVYAPGVAIESADFSSSTGMKVDSGTSPASAHVAGVAALALQLNPSFSPAQVAQLIHDSATRGAIVPVNCETINLLVYSGLTPSTEPIPDIEKCGGCIVNALVATEDAPARLLAPLYMVRDKLFAESEYGQHLTELYYGHSNRMIELIFGDEELREGAFELLHVFLPGIEAIFDTRAEDVRLTPEMVAQTHQFLEGLAKADDGGTLTDVIAEEMENIPWSDLEDRTFADAWVLILEVNQ